MNSFRAKYIIKNHYIPMHYIILLKVFVTISCLILFVHSTYLDSQTEPPRQKKGKQMNVGRWYA